MPNRAGVEAFLKRPESEIALSFLVFLSCVLFALQTLDGVVAGQPGGMYLGKGVLKAIDVTEFGIGLLFLLEYFLRWYYKGFDPRYPFTPLMLIDGAVILPTILRLLGVPMFFGDISFEFLRLLRVLRLQRFFSNAASFQRTFGKVWAGAGDVKVWQLEIVRIILSIATLLFVSTGLMYECEHAVNPQFSDFFAGEPPIIIMFRVQELRALSPNMMLTHLSLSVSCVLCFASPIIITRAALYFGLTTLTTVGFGDIAPITPLGRAVVSFSILFGITIIPVQLSSLASALLSDKKIDTSVSEAAEATAAALKKSAKWSIKKVPTTTVMAGVHEKDEVFAEALAFALANELVETFPEGLPSRKTIDAGVPASETFKVAVSGASRRAIDRAMHTKLM
jgi:voltage-gated potassium channel Kch